jgi:hypothetical protein
LCETTTLGLPGMYFLITGASAIGYELTAPPPGPVPT